jgi:hypothetical protein
MLGLDKCRNHRKLVALAILLVSRGELVVGHSRAKIPGMRNASTWMAEVVPSIFAGPLQSWFERTRRRGTPSVPTYQVKWRQILFRNTVKELGQLRSRDSFLSR